MNRDQGKNNVLAFCLRVSSGPCCCCCCWPFGGIRWTLIKTNNVLLLSLPKAKWQKQWKRPFQLVTGTSMEPLSTRTRQRLETASKQWSRMAWWKGKIFSSSAKWDECETSSPPHVSFGNAASGWGTFMLAPLLLSLVAVVHFPQKVHDQGDLWEDSQWS